MGTSVDGDGRPGVASPTAAGGGGTAGRVPVSVAAPALTHATAVGAGGRAGRGGRRARANSSADGAVKTSLL